MDENLEFNAKLFLELAIPFRSKYNRKDENEWHFCKSYLGIRQIERAIRGEITLGFFSTHSTRLLIFDIDAHIDRISDERRTELLLPNSLRVIKAMGRDPAFAFRTPRGLHLWYLFDFPRSVALLQAWASSHFPKQTLPRYVEMFPQPGRGIRIPVRHRLVDPRTMQPKKWDGQLTIEPAPDFRAESPSTFVRKSHRRRLNRMDVARLLNGVTFRRGRTNQAFVELVRNLARGGMSEGKTYDVLSAKLSADGYVGDLKGKRLEDRIASIFRSIPNRSEKHARIELSPKLERYSYELAGRSPFTAARKDKLFRFLCEMFTWITYLRNLSPAEKAERRDRYPFSETKMKKGWYPIPVVVMKGWNRNYKPLLDWLLVEGYLIDRTGYRPSGRIHYDHNQKVGKLVGGSCRYFSVRDIAIALRANRPQIYNTLLLLLRKTETHKTFLASLRGGHQGELHHVIRSWFESQTARDERSLYDYFHQESKQKLSPSSLANFVKRNPDLSSVRASDPEGRQVRLLMKSGEQLPPGWQRIRSPSELTLQSVRQAASFLLDDESRAIDLLKAKTRDFLAVHISSREAQRNFSSLFKQAMKQLKKSGEFSFTEFEYRWNHERL